MSPRTLQDYLAPRISVNLNKTNNKIDNIALAADPELLRWTRKPRSKSTEKKAPKKKHRIEKLEENPASQTMENIKLKDFIEEGRKASVY